MGLSRERRACHCIMNDRFCEMVEADVRMWDMRLSDADAKMLADAGVSREAAPVTS